MNRRSNASECAGYFALFVGVLFVMKEQSYAQQMIFPGDQWVTASPESVLIDPEKLQQAVEQLGDPHHLLVVKHGRVIWAGDGAYDAREVASVTKSFAGTALGLLVDDGALSLDTRAQQFLPALSAEYPEVTFRHLVTHTSGFRGTVYDPESPWFSPPGSQFKYDESYRALAHALTRAAGESLLEVFTRRIADPIDMDLSAFDWSSSVDREGRVVNMGTSGVIISADNAARFGHLFLNRGNWDGSQLISSDWGNAATQLKVDRTIASHPQSGTGSLGPGRYGYGWWISGKWYEAVGGSNSHLSVNSANDLVIAALTVPGAPPFEAEHTSFQTAVTAASIPAIWDDQGDGNWDDIDATTGKPRWVTESGLIPDVYPTSQAIIRSNVVTIPDSLKIHSDGLIAIEQQGTLEVAGDLEANAIEISGGGTLIVDGDFAAHSLTQENGIILFHDNQSPIVIGGLVNLGDHAQLRFNIATAPWDSPIKFADPRRAPGLAGSLVLDFSDASNLASLEGTTLNLFDWAGAAPTSEFGQVIYPDHVELDLSQLYVSGEITVVSAIPEPAAILLISVLLVSLLLFRVRSHHMICFSFAIVATCAMNRPSAAQFDTIINIPPDTPPTSIGSNTQLNLMDGGGLSGSFQSPFQAGRGDGSSTNVEVNIVGGTVGPYFNANAGSRVDISGGTIGRAFRALSGSDVTLFGGEFLLDGEMLSNTSVTLADSSVLTGTLQDGAPFILSTLNGDQLHDVTLESVSLPPVDTSPMTVDSVSALTGLRTGQSLTLVNGGVLGKNFAAVNATINVEGGETSRLEMTGTHADIAAGNVGGISALADSVVSIAGGSVGSVSAYPGSRVVVTNGNVSGVYADGGEASVEDGNIGGLTVTDAGVLDVSGGVVDGYIGIDVFGGIVNISGGSFTGQDKIAWIGGHEDILTVANVSGGTFSSHPDRDSVFQIDFNSEVSITGGSFDAISTDSIWEDPQPGYRKLDIAGGTFGSLEFISGEPLSEFTIHGNDFRLNGVPIEGLDNIGDTILLERFQFQGPITGILADGTPIHIGAHGDHATVTFHSEIRRLGNVMLQVTEVPPVVPGVFTASTDELPWGIREGQTLVVDSGGVVGNQFVAGRGSLVQVEDGGVVGDNFETVGAEIAISGGVIGDFFGAFEGSNVEISGGVIGKSEAVDSRLSISAGTIEHLDMYRSDLQISGGHVRRIVVEDANGNDVSIVGGEFSLNGVEIADPGTVGEFVMINLPRDSDDLLLGVLADGTLFSSANHVFNGTVALEITEVPPPSPDPLVASIDGPLAGIRNGQTLIVDAGSKLAPNFIALAGSTLVVESGSTVEGPLLVMGGDVHIEGGMIGEIQLSQDSYLHIVTGIIDRFEADSGSRIDIAGGTIGTGNRIRSGSEIHLYGMQFAIDGDELEIDSFGTPVRISERRRGMELAGTLADGSPFEFELNDPLLLAAEDYFSRDATLTVTLVTLLDGDYDSNGTVEQGDLDLVLLNWGEELFNPFAAGWINDLPSGTVGQQELDKVLLGWGNAVDGIGIAAVPEPATVLLLLSFLAVALVFRAAYVRRITSDI